jgi:signal transduction histidine kinase
MDSCVSRVLDAVFGAVGDAGGYQDVLVRICRAMVEAVPCDRATIYTYSRRTRRFRPRADHGTPDEIARRFSGRAFDPRVFTELATMRAGGLISASRLNGAPEVVSILEDADLSALALVPLMLYGETEGTISCGLGTTPTFESEQLDALQRVAPHVSLLVRKARVEDAAARLAQRRTYLAIFGAELLAVSDVDAVRHDLPQMARDIFQASGAWLVLVEGDELVGRADDDPPVRIPLAARSACGDAIRLRQVLTVNDYARSVYADATEAARRYRPASALVVPLVDDTGPLGALMMHDLHHPYRFGPTDEEDARILATIATAAIRKAVLIEQLTRANRAKNDFLASVSHDLRTPLNIITGYAQLLHEETFGPIVREQRDALERILRTTGDQLALINDLLDLARIEQGKLACTPRPVAIASFVPSLGHMMDVLLHTRPVAFETDVPPDVVAHADPERVRQILVNLLTNAAKFTQAGCVRLVAALDGDAVRVSVEDTGAGIDPGLRDRVLEPFVHGAGEGAGSGLGLAIVARLLGVMHGSIDIASEPGRGTRVDIRLPLPR